MFRISIYIFLLWTARCGAAKLDCLQLGDRIVVNIGRFLRNEGDYRVDLIGEDGTSRIERWSHFKEGSVEAFKNYSAGRLTKVEQKQRAMENDWMASIWLKKAVAQFDSELRLEVALIDPLPGKKLVARVENYFGEDLEKYYYRVYNQKDLRPLLRRYQRILQSVEAELGKDKEIEILQIRNTGYGAFHSKEITFKWKSPLNRFPERYITIHLKPSNFIVKPETEGLVIVDPN